MAVKCSSMAGKRKQNNGRGEWQDRLSVRHFMNGVAQSTSAFLPRSGGPRGLSAGPALAPCLRRRSRTKKKPPPKERQVFTTTVNVMSRSRIWQEIIEKPRRAMRAAQLTKFGELFGIVRRRDPCSQEAALPVSAMEKPQGLQGGDLGGFGIGVSSDMQ